MLRQKWKDVCLSPWDYSDFDAVTYMIDYPWTVKMITSLMKGHWANFGILSVDVPEPTTKVEVCNDNILDNKVWSWPSVKVVWKSQKRYSVFLCVWSLLFNPMLIFSLPLPPCAHLPRDSFHLKIENYAYAIYLFLWFNNKQKEWGRTNMVIFTEKNNV